jgi:hypothetical protein
MLQLEKPFIAVGINVVAHRRSTEGNGFPQDLLYGGVQFAQLLSGERGGTTARPDAGAK